MLRSSSIAWRIFVAVAPIGLGCETGDATPTDVAAPVRVQVEAVERRAVPNEFRFIGSVEAMQRVELRARVRGFVTDIGFNEGSLVQQNQVLFTIDDRPYRAALRAASASLRRSEAQLAEAERQLVREQRLRTSGVNAAEAVETAQTDVDALQAQVAEQRAAFEQAKLDVAYCKVVAPFTGRIGERLVDIGALVGDQNSTLLGVLVQEDPLFVRFSPTERERLLLLGLYPELEHPEGGAGAPVHLELSNGKPYPHDGKVAFVDNALDPGTRSLTFKALVPNPKRSLKPGESVSVTLELPPSERLLVPSVAVASVQDIDYVYVVDEQSIARYREIEIGQSVQDARVVLDGLEPGERVVVRGLQRLRDGAVVELEATAAAAGPGIGAE